MTISNDINTIQNTTSYISQVQVSGCCDHTNPVLKFPNSSVAYTTALLTDKGSGSNFQSISGSNPD